ncbi:uncharacterized protein BJ212DRAFT_1297587 [Suillus subaureus]|uniref:Uncharacterized protein n=1 Tax=Suillus subaureus TaxID=48587 RepID=A0A9P7JG83_9AGAM|nr:uncharacterized protein BJ212DRAFT_1297587 [Suillus subaureus]KAG1821169.1 hypothetical protein BJ212DRAFT_1297587 [Suillus subaureus]
MKTLFTVNLNTMTVNDRARNRHFPVPNEIDSSLRDLEEYVRRIVREKKEAEMEEARCQQASLSSSKAILYFMFGVSRFPASAGKMTHMFTLLLLRRARLPAWQTVKMAEEMVVSAPTLVAGPFGTATPKIAFPAHVVGTGLAAVASRSLRPFVGFLRALGAFSVSAHGAHTSMLASYADVWDSVMTAWKKRAKKLSIGPGGNLFQCQNCQGHLCNTCDDGGKSRCTCNQILCKLCEEECQRCAHFRRLCDNDFGFFEFGSGDEMTYHNF